MLAYVILYFIIGWFWSIFSYEDFNLSRENILSIFIWPIEIGLLSLVVAYDVYDYIKERNHK